MCVAESVVWEHEVKGRTAYYTCPVDDLLAPKQVLLAAFRYLVLLHEGQAHDAKDILAMKLHRNKGQPDLEGQYYPYMLHIFQVWAVPTCRSSVQLV